MSSESSISSGDSNVRPVQSQPRSRSRAYQQPEGNFLSAQLHGSHRNFDMQIIDQFGKEVIHLFREYRCCSLNVTN
uniref:Phospholipid scramblase n=1 Tax=Strigamia maritima TaxID=126957 RepID=T1IP04_STRMM